MTDLDMRLCTSPTELFHQYDGQFEAQPAYIELGLKDGILLADYDSEIGGAVPSSVFHGFDVRWSVPVLTGAAANRVLKQVAPLARRMLADWEEVWNGNNMVARLGEDARAAHDEIRDVLDSASDDVVDEWDVDAAVNGDESSEFGITAQTTDERLREIEREILADLAGCSVAKDPVVVCAGLGAYLEELRERAREEDDEE
ncbi:MULTISPECIES: hypothetical protein [unclassified Streptomyces]|uniref:hypothetical protein n=1 Tax=unclassified Streptomyces TaxID=2593676 RepID=UPI000BACEAFB|nr:MULTISPECIES: hypothetical protein [unclassified Streptomyces]ASY37020.1 hypothetical protein CAC01_30755 [Streptomyces sp. CLI2509]MYX20415.1 hypothetical protein [Streptomyces sp. SID8380]